MNIKGSVAVVTGAAGGIGQAMVMELALRGARGVAVVDQSGVVREVAEAVNSRVASTVAVGYSGDVTSQEFRAEV